MLCFTTTAAATTTTITTTTTTTTTISNRAIFLAERAGTAFRNLFEGTKFQKSKSKIINKSSVSVKGDFPR
jgi:hypothetical protein